MPMPPVLMKPRALLLVGLFICILMSVAWLYQSPALYAPYLEIIKTTPLLSEPSPTATAWDNQKDSSPSVMDSDNGSKPGVLDDLEGLHTDQSYGEGDSNSTSSRSISTILIPHHNMETTKSNHPQPTIIKVEDDVMDAMKDSAPKATGTAEENILDAMKDSAPQLRPGTAGGTNASDSSSTSIPPTRAAQTPALSLSTSKTIPATRTSSSKSSLETKVPAKETTGSNLTDSTDHWNGWDAIEHMFILYDLHRASRAER
jgi:hypothetical protein